MFPPTRHLQRTKCPCRSWFRLCSPVAQAVGTRWTRGGHSLPKLPDPIWATEKRDFRPRFLRFWYTFIYAQLTLRVRFVLDSCRIFVPSYIVKLRINTGFTGHLCRNAWFLLKIFLACARKSGSNLHYYHPFCSIEAMGCSPTGCSPSLFYLQEYDFL